MAEQSGQLLAVDEAWHDLMVNDGWQPIIKGGTILFWTKPAPGCMAVLDRKAAAFYQEQNRVPASFC